MGFYPGMGSPTLAAFIAEQDAKLSDGRLAEIEDWLDKATPTRWAPKAVRELLDEIRRLRKAAEEA